MRKHIEGTYDLEPIVKWPGGKEKELEQIVAHAPNNFNTFYEPFVGGGSVFMAIIANHYMINDFSEELTHLYWFIQATDEEFFGLLNGMAETWQNAYNFFAEHNEELSNHYIDYRNDAVDYTTLCGVIDNFINQNNHEVVQLLDEINPTLEILSHELYRNLCDKLRRMKKIEQEKGLLPNDDLADNIETSIKGSVYMYYRYLYNHTALADNERLKTALFFFLRNYAYSGMFRYSANGDFNVPYGGIAYNSKALSHKIDFYLSEETQQHFARTNIFNLDFEEFLLNNPPAPDDFMFLDPPYDSEFSTYDKKEFTRHDQERLANYLIHACPCRWMLIIKRTDFIYNLYANQPNVNMMAFDKRYVVSFMNRNDRDVTHLLITNYNLEEQ